MKPELLLYGLDGSNPLAFLAALGTLRVLSLKRSNAPTRMHWRIESGAWRPVLTGAAYKLKCDLILGELDEYLSDPAQLDLFQEIGPDLAISGKRLRFLAEESIKAILSQPSNSNAARIGSDFLSAFGCDAITSDGDADSQIEDTAFRTMSGAGHQHFIKFMREIIASTDESHLRKTLFESWAYDDPGRGLNLRWDPADDRRYALRWRNPSNEPNTTMRGANRLAIEALPLFTTAPMKNKLETAGFIHRYREGVRWTWPLWDTPVEMDVVRSLLQSHLLIPPNQLANELQTRQWRHTLSRMGVVAIFQSRRITTGKFRNFTPAEALW